MNAAFSIWDDRIAPVLDSALTLAFVPVAPQTSQPMIIGFDRATPGVIIKTLLAHHASVLVCGAASSPLQDVITSRGIAVIPFVSGEFTEVVQGWRDGRLRDRQFCMPGCGHGRGRKRRTRRQGDHGGEQVGEQAGEFRRQTRKNTSLPYGAVKFSVERSFCNCPNCGAMVASVPGTPCAQRHCPHCRAPLVRA